MFRNRVRPPTPPLDEVTAERLLHGAPIEDVPDAFRPLGRLLADATGPPTGDELAGSAAAAAQFVAVHEAADEPTRRTRSMATSVFLAFALAASTGAAVAATQGALPGPVQRVAHAALAAVGIDVPGTTNGGRVDGGDGGDSSPAVAVSTPATPSAPTSDGVGGPTVPAAGSGPATTPATGDDGSSVGGGSGQGDHPSARHDDGAGQGTPGSGDGNQGDAGRGNEGNQGQVNHGNPGAGPSDPGSGRPSPSDGKTKGNGPAQVPPGQAK